MCDSYDARARNASPTETPSGRLAQIACHASGSCRRGAAAGNGRVPFGGRGRDGDRQSSRIGGSSSPHLVMKQSCGDTNANRDATQQNHTSSLPLYCNMQMMLSGSRMPTSNIDNTTVDMHVSLSLFMYRQGSPGVQHLVQSCQHELPDASSAMDKHRGRTRAFTQPHQAPPVGMKPSINTERNCNHRHRAHISVSIELIFFGRPSTFRNHRARAARCRGSAQAVPDAMALAA